MDVVAEEPAADADAADGFWEKDQIFPRVKERDAYRRLGISDEASFEEVQDARNYLVQTYARHTAGVEAIEEAFDRIIKQKLTARKKTRGLRAAMRKQKAKITPRRSWTGSRRSSSVRMTPRSCAGRSSTPS